MFCDRNKTMMMQNSRTVRRSVDANEQARERAKTTPLRNEAQLNCVSLRSQLLCGDSIQHGRELALGGLNTRKTDKSGGAVGRPHCQSSLLSDPNPKFSAEMWRKPQRTMNSKEGRHVGLDFYDLLIEELIDPRQNSGSPASSKEMLPPAATSHLLFDALAVVASPSEGCTKSGH